MLRPYEVPVKSSLRSINKQPKKNINAKVINDLGLDFFSKYILYKLSMFKPMPNKIINFISPLSNIFYNSPFPRLSDHRFIAASNSGLTFTSSGLGKGSYEGP